MRRADRRDGRRDEAIDTNPLTPPNTLTHPPNPHIPSNPRTRPMCSGFPHVISRIAVVVECRPQSRVIKPQPKPETFGDIWCRFVSFGPAPHIYQRGERVRELARPFTAAIRIPGRRSGRARRYRGTSPTLAAYT